MLANDIMENEMNKVEVDREQLLKLWRESSERATAVKGFNHGEYYYYTGVADTCRKLYEERNEQRDIKTDS